MSTDKIRRELEALRARKAEEGCPGCGYPSYKLDPKTTKVQVRMRRPGEPRTEDQPPEYCEVCGREEKRIVIRFAGLPDRSKGGAWRRERYEQE